MGRINWARVVLGGVVAGIVIGVFSAVFIPMFASSWRAAIGALGGQALEPDAAFIAGGTAINMATGILAIWLYAAIRPRYGAGVTTAAIAGFAVWSVLMLANLSLVLLTNLTLAMVASTHGPNLVTFVLSTIAGAWVYREAVPQAAAPAAAATPVHAQSGT